MAEFRSTGAENEAEQPLKSGLYVVATPIGNLGDITGRALETLRRVDAIACEDTRVTAKLLNAYLIRKPLIAYHEHNAAAQRPKLLSMIEEGKSVALVSDAGTPLISDPGYKLVAEAGERALYVTTLPGASALTAALTLAGLPTDRFLFLGFPPNKSKARQSWFEAEKDQMATLVCYESAKRLAASLADAATALGNRQAAVCREISKKFEQVVRGNLEDLAQRYADSGPPKGEIVLVIAPPTAHRETTEEISSDTQSMLKAALKHMSVKSASEFVAEVSGLRKKELYRMALDIQAESGDG